MADVARRTAERLARIFKALGRPSPWGEAEPSEPDTEPLSLEQPGVFACAMHTPRARTPSPEPDEYLAEALGVNVYAKQRVDGRLRAISWGTSR